MQAKLFCKTGQLAGAKFEIAKEATIGKSSDNEIVLYPGIISGKHARLYFDAAENCYFLEDLRSRNGTKLDGIRVTQKEKLGPLHVITFAEKFDFIFRISGATAPRAEGRTPEQRTQPVAPPTLLGADDFIMLPPNLADDAKDRPQADVQRTVIGAENILVPELKVETEGPQGPTATPVDKTVVSRTQAGTAVFLLEVKSPGNEIKTIELKNGENVLGRSPGCDIHIDDSSLSRRHAVITVKAGKVTVKDLGSKNRTFIGAKEISGEVEVRLDTKLKFGAVEAELVRKM